MLLRTLSSLIAEKRGKFSAARLQQHICMLHLRGCVHHHIVAAWCSPREAGENGAPIGKFALRGQREDASRQAVCGSQFDSRPRLFLSKDTDSSINSGRGARTCGTLCPGWRLIHEFTPQRDQGRERSTAWSSAACQAGDAPRTMPDIAVDSTTPTS